MICTACVTACVTAAAAAADDDVQGEREIGFEMRRQGVEEAHRDTQIKAKEAHREQLCDPL